MNMANRSEAAVELDLDVSEGADILMVKPAGPYLDIISDYRHSCGLPIAAYQVSGEYAMLKAAAMNGWLSEKEVVLEALLSFKRAGADGVLTYFTPDVLHWLSS